MKRTIPFVVSCLILLVVGDLLLPSKLVAVGSMSQTTMLPPNDTLFFSLADCNEKVDICLDDLPLILAANIPILVNGIPYQNMLSACSFDTTHAYTYATLFGTGHLGPYQLLDWIVGDSMFSGVFENIPDLVDSMNLWDATGHWQLDTSALLISGGSQGITYSSMSVEVVATSLPSTIGYNFGMEAVGTQLSFGLGMHRVLIKDTITNTIRKAEVVVSCTNQNANPTTETIYHTINQGDSLEICVDTTELSGIVIEIDDFCENIPSETIIFNINNVDLCFEVTAENIGTDSICVVICDNFLICDTTYFIISVVSNSPSLTATPDSDTTSINSPIIIHVLGNDIIPGDDTLTTMELVPANGELTNGAATTNPDRTITYTPNTDFCGDWEQWQYFICNATECDTAAISIYVACTARPLTELKIYNGFSPNGDGLNDHFTIEGIAQYPNNELFIFSRWGTRVYQAKGYKNAWEGTWNRKQLPSGTYFYLLNDGEGKAYSGYLQIEK